MRMMTSIWILLKTTSRSASMYRMRIVVNNMICSRMRNRHQSVSIYWLEFGNGSGFLTLNVLRPTELMKYSDGQLNT